MKIEVTLGIDVGGTNTAFGFVDITVNVLPNHPYLLKHIIVLLIFLQDYILK